MKWLVNGLIVVLSVGVLNQVNAHDSHAEHSASALAVSLATDSDGRLWQARANKGQVWVSASEDAGKHFSPEVAVNTAPMKVSSGAEARPKIAVASNGNIYLSWTETLKKAYAGYVWFARSTDGGKHFETPYIVHQDRAEITHAFEALQLAADGTITIAWVDKRDLVAAKAAGKTYDGAAIYYAVSTDQGKSFMPEKKLADSSCECCRIAMTSKPDSTVAVLWRHVFEGSERDHAMAEINKAGSEKSVKPAIVRASYGRWKIDGCPHHGAALAVGEGFGYHLSYFDGSGNKPGLRLVRMDGQAWVMTPPRPIGDPKKNAGHPALLSMGDKVWLAWQERNNEGMDIMTMTSLDGGKSWGLPTLAVHTAGKLDYPQWLNVRGQAMLAVNSSEKGLLVMPSPQ